MNKKKIRKFLYFLGIISGGALLINQLILTIRAIPNIDFSKNAYLFIILSIFFAIIAIGVQIAGWFILINSEDYAINFASVIKGYTISFLPRYLPGTILGYISRGEWLFQNHSIPFSMSNSISIWEITASLIANILIILVYLINKYLPAYQIILLVLPLIPLLLHKILEFVFLKLNKMKITVFGKLIQINIAPKKQWYLSILLFIFHWIFLGFSLSQILFSLGVNKMGFLNIVFSGNLSWLSGFFVFFAPAGLGYREATLSYLLTNYFGISQGISSITSGFFRLSTIIGELVWILLGLFLGRISKRRVY